MPLIQRTRPSRTIPTLGAFARRWTQQMAPQWKPSYQETVDCTLGLWILPTFGDWRVDEITRATLLEFRAAVAKDARKPSPARVNKIMNILCACLVEAGRQHPALDAGALSVRQLRETPREIQPLSLAEVDTLLALAAPPWRDYYTVRFFTGLRTGEIDGLCWQDVDLGRRTLRVRQALVKNKLETPKTPCSKRDVDLVPGVVEALRRQHARTGKGGGFVFCAANGSPLRHGNVRRRIWLPLLKRAGLAPRRQYETRHTYATLMLASGENPEYIRRQLGHANVQMLFTVYSRYVPNLTRQDGSAFNALLSAPHNGATGARG